MKNFNLDNLERKTPYKIPENFFEDMQENVLKETVFKNNNIEREPKRFALNFYWATSIAASLALILGLNFFFNSDNINTINQSSVAQNTENITNTVAAKSDVSSDNVVLQNHEKQIIQEINSAEKSTQSEPITSVQNSNDLATNETLKAANVNVEEVLGSLSDSELAELNQNNEQDIYLELYN